MAISSPLQSKVPTGSARTIKKLQGILLNRTKVKREIFQRQTILQSRREENERRKQREDELEAPNLVTKPRGAAGLISGSARGFFDRLIGFLGYLTAGWIINNLPTWISMGKEFIARTQQMGKILGGFITNSTDIFKDFTKLLGATLTNLMTFDFLDTSGRVSTAFDELNLSVENWGTDFEDAIKLLTTPLSEGIASGENARPTGTENTNEGAYETSAPYSGSGGENPKDLKSGAQLLMRKGFSEKGAAYLAGNIQQESGWNAMRKPWILSDGAGTNKGLISWNRTRITAAEKFLGKPLETATASEQIDWIKEEMKQYGVLKTFQDKNATDEQLKKASYDYIVWGDLGARWKYSEVALQHLRKSGPGSSQSQSPQQSSAQAPSQSTLPPLPPTDTLSGGVQRYGASRDNGKRKHAGVDFDINGPNAKFYSRIGGVVVGSPFRFGADGWAIDIYNKELKVYERIAEAAKIVVKPGQTIKPGDLVAQGESNTGVIHYEIRKKIEGGFENSLDPIAFLRSSSTLASATPQSTTAPATAQSQTPAPAQITPTGTPQNPQISQSLAPERTGPTVIVSQNPSSPAQQMISSGGGGSSGGESSPISDFALLNNFIKNKLLLDLAYL
jgi:hypothetical protein